MADQTPLFKQCINIIQSEIKTAQIKPIEQPNYIIKDTFLKECFELYQILTNLNQFINEIKLNYLALNDDKGLSTIEKDNIDEELQVKIQQTYKKLTYLENYESKRNELINKHSNWTSIFGGKSDQSIYFETLSSHRNAMLKFLMECVNYVNSKFTNIQNKRHVRERQINSLNFQNIDEEEEEMDDVQITNLESLEVERSGESYFSQEQLQELETENKEFLHMKTNQLKQVEKVQQSIMDIINIQNELSFKLQSQGDQISNLIDVHSQVEMEVKSGNKQLNQATKKNKRSANLLVMLCFILGILLVIIDYIKFI
ncbi:unnamed protein product [Candida verbasci]|uniref:t-SNARE coiled-coil homology domain-containing protein n=1 Tax=Candida verbasci TaxID=1227364 RepID=A0A9W4TZE0_9ASCO|nr:unnamed protein product [Candida verbasci]